MSEKRRMKTLNPTVIVGIGGTGAHILQILSKRLGPLVVRCPPMSFLVLDTDPLALSDSTRTAISELHSVCLSDPDILDRSSLPLVSVGSDINRQTVAQIFANPDHLYEMAAHTFELFIAEIYTGLGYEVELTKRTRDGGVDMFLKKTVDGMRLKFAVQCKHTQTTKTKIGVGLVRELLGSVIDKAVTVGVLITNALFSNDALDFADRQSSRLFCIDGFGLRGLMVDYLIATA